MKMCECGAVFRSSVAAASRCKCGRIVQNQSRGLGDTIHKITTALHIPHCGGCENRPILSRQGLNKLVPYKQE
jgi:hypothetical protein